MALPQITLPRRPKGSATRRPTASSPVTGVRIGATHVALALAAPSRGPLSVVATATAPLPHGAVRDGEVVDAAAVASALRQAMDGRNGFDRKVRLGIGCQKVAVRILDVPPTEHEEDQDAAVRAVARDRIPTAADGAVIDYRMLADGSDDDGRPVHRALVVAARRDLVDGQVAAAQAAGMQPIGIDLVAFGLSRCVQAPEPTLLLDLDGVTTLALTGPDGCRFVRTIPAGAQSAAEEVSRRTGAAADAAVETLLGHRTVEGEDADDVAAILQRTVRAIASTVRTSIEFHVEQEAGPQPTSCIVSGPLADLDGVHDLLAEVLSLPVESATTLAGGADPVALGLSVEEVHA
ncbi:MAG: pilus assembly protein PilM [Solirubrobacteraceae bacterium]|nr:pilus assembly protein PilM [Solirubrobacteraceae bacterium]